MMQRKWHQKNLMEKRLIPCYHQDTRRTLQTRKLSIKRKSYLKLRTECHSPSYDAITSHMVIVSLRYMILEHARFQNSDNRTIEDLFYQMQREVVNSIMDTAIVIIVDALLNAVRKCFNVTEEQMDQLLIEFVNELPAPWKSRFRLPACFFDPRTPEYSTNSGCFSLRSMSDYLYAKC